MKVGDLVTTYRVIKDWHHFAKIGFITKIQDRHGDGINFYFVRFPDRGNGYWYHPSKLRILSEAR